VDQPLVCYSPILLSLRKFEYYQQRALYRYDHDHIIIRSVTLCIGPLSKDIVDTFALRVYGFPPPVQIVYYGRTESII
jgi:hypothetical protein